MPKKIIDKKTSTEISKYMSYLLRHNPKGLNLDKEGFVDLEHFLKFVQNKYKSLDKNDLISIARENERYEIKNNRIRAIYGHSIDVSYNLEQIEIDKLYHGTTQKAAEKILKEGLNPMGRKRVHLSKTIEAAIRVGKRRTKNPIILIINASEAIKEGIKIEKATDKVYLTEYIPPKFIRIKLS
ncbi:MAG: RNA 2'-phosphotransferase [Candidatus Hodarchaeota archaeon]